MLDIFDTTPCSHYICVFDILSVIRLNQYLHLILEEQRLAVLKICKRLGAGAQVPVQEPVAGAIKCGCSEYQGCVVLDPHHVFLIHYQTLAAPLCRFPLSPFVTVLSSFSSSVFPLCVFFPLLLSVNVWIVKISADPQKWVPMAPTTNHRLKLGTGSRPFFYHCLQFYIALTQPEGIGALHMSTCYITQGHIDLFF